MNNETYFGHNNYKVKERQSSEMLELHLDLTGKYTAVCNIVTFRGGFDAWWKGWKTGFVSQQ